MIDIIRNTRKDPLGAMILDYLHGRQEAYVEVDSDTLDMWRMTGKKMFRSFQQMDELEKLALNRCEGPILDVGAGSGCHSLYLQEQGQTVDALDISPGCVQVMVERKVKNVIHQNLFSLKEKKYKTILMLMNGLGICGTLDGCNLFLQFITTILEDRGQVIADSTDLGLHYDDPGGHDYQGDGYYGETECIMRYRDIVSEPFNWIYVDFSTIERLAAFNGLTCEQLSTDVNGRYLMRIFKKSG